MTYPYTALVEACRREPAMRAQYLERVQRMVAEVDQQILDAEHWNRINPKSEPLALDYSFIEPIRRLLRELREIEPLRTEQ